LFFILGIGLIIPILAGLITIYSILSPLFMTATKADSGKKYTLMDTFMNIIEYKMRVIMFIVSYFVISDAYSSYGSYSALVAIIACLLLYFFTDIYKQYIPENKTPWNSDFKQAAKSGQIYTPSAPESSSEIQEPVLPESQSIASIVPESQSIASSVPESQEPALEPQQTSTQPPPGGEIELRNLNPPLITQKPGDEVGNNQLGGRIKKRHSRKNVKL